jgi:hypothetical protein
VPRDAALKPNWKWARRLKMIQRIRWKLKKGKIHFC